MIFSIIHLCSLIVNIFLSFFDILFLFFVFWIFHIFQILDFHQLNVGFLISFFSIYYSYLLQFRLRAAVFLLSHPQTDEKHRKRKNDCGKEAGFDSVFGEELGNGTDYGRSGCTADISRQR